VPSTLKTFTFPGLHHAMTVKVNIQHTGPQTRDVLHPGTEAKASEN